MFLTIVNVKTVSNMPSSTQRLREKFMKKQDGSIDDGIDAAQKVIRDAGGEIKKNHYIDISNIKEFNGDVQDAIDFLIDEWDFGIL